MDFTQLFEAAKSQLGSALALAAVVTYFIWRERGKQKLEDADNAGSVRAIDEWTAIAQSLREANRELTLRADAFAKERNELIASLGRLEGEIKSLQSTISSQALQIQAQRDEIQALRSEVQKLRSQQ
ncbi:hypothetical protein GCM10027276_44160 [Comamonas piscis]